MKRKSFIKTASLVLLFSVIFFWNSPAWSWGIFDKQILLLETVSFNGSGGCTLDSMEYEQERYFDDGPMVNLFPAGQTDYALPNTYTTTCSEESVLEESVSYSTAETGYILFTFSDSTMNVAVSPDLNTLIYSRWECSGSEQYCNVFFGAGVKRGADKSTADLNGTFAVYEFESIFHNFNYTWIDPSPATWGMNDKQVLIQSNFNFNGTTGVFTGDETEYSHDRMIMDTEFVNLFEGSGATDYALPNQYQTNCTGPNSESGETGNFSVATDGEVTITFYEDGSPDVITAYLSDNENVLVFAESGCSNSDKHCFMALGFGVKRGSQMSGESLYGTFTVYEFESGFHGGDPGYKWGMYDQLNLIQTEVSFDGSGNFEVISGTEYVLERQIIDGPKIDLFSGGIDDYALPNKHTTTCQQSPESGETGTYTVSSNGDVTLNFYQGDTISGVLSIDGNVLIFSFSECNDNDRYCSIDIGVGVKQGSGLNNASLTDFVYKAGALETGFHGGDPIVPTPPPPINPGVLHLLLML